MFRLEELKPALVHDIQPGNIVARKSEGTFHPGVLVRTNLGEGEYRGILFFSEKTGDRRVPIPAFEFVQDYEPILDTGVRPELRWSGDFASVSDWMSQVPSIGHIVVVDKKVGVSGKVRQVGPRHDGQLFYWDFKTGSHLGPFDSRRAIYVSKWRVGWRDVDDEFRELSAFSV